MTSRVVALKHARIGKVHGEYDVSRSRTWLMIGDKIEGSKAEIAHCWRGASWTGQRYDSPAYRGVAVIMFRDTLVIKDGLVAR